MWITTVIVQLGKVGTHALSWIWAFYNSEVVYTIWIGVTHFTRGGNGCNELSPLKDIFSRRRSVTQPRQMPQAKFDLKITQNI